MPLPSRLTRQLGTAIPNIQNDQYAQDRGEGAFNGITNEVIDFVYSDGSYGVSGMHLTTTGISQPLTVGQIVQVGWRGGVAQAILSHNALRSKYTPLGVQAGAPLVEELFSDGTTIWFRNGDQFTPLLPNKTGAAGKVPITAADLGLSSLGLVHWGKGDASLLCVEGLKGTDIVWVVCRLNRPKPNEPFPRAFKVRITPQRAYNLTTDPATFGTFSIAVNPGGHISSAPLKYINPQLIVSGAPDSVVDMTGDAPRPIYQGVAPNGDLLVTINVFGTAFGAGVAQVAFVLGSLLINVTKSIVLANHLALTLSTQVFDSQTPAASPVCTVLGTAEIDASLGGSVPTSGDVTVLSLTGIKPADVGTFNNYALIGPARFQGGDTLFNPSPGSIFCYPARADIRIRIVGEFAELLNITFAGSNLGPSVSQTPLIQGSRTMLLIGTFSENGQSLANLKIAWLPRNEISIIQNAPSFQSFDADGSFAPFFPQQWIQARAYYVTQASQVYSPRETLPYSITQHPPLIKRPTFISSSLNRGSGVIVMDFKDPKSTLNGLGVIAPAKTPAQQTVVTTVPMSDLQVIDSKTALKAAFQSGVL